MSRLTWSEVVERFNVISAGALMELKEMPRHQEIREAPGWLLGGEPPLGLLFISHRWETLLHPDPTGRQLVSVQRLLEYIVTCVLALLLPKNDRLRLVPSVRTEGLLQAQEIARRMMGFGTFRDSTAAATGRDAREEVRSQWEQCGHDAQSFRSWLLGRIGVWVDYMCMPQAPHSEAERLEFREALAWLDGLVVSSTVVSLRDAGDDYPERGWCAAEFFLASGRSFQRGLFVTQGRLMTGQDALVGPSPDADGHAESMAVKVMADGYGMDLQAFEEACGEWETLDVALIDTSPPDAWGAYRALQGSGFWTPELDPNPFRRAMEAIRGLEGMLVRRWLMCEGPSMLAIGMEVGGLLSRHGLHCAKESDLTYLGFLLACHGWVDAFRPLMRRCLELYLLDGGVRAAEGAPSIRVMLIPPGEELRTLLSQLHPNSPAAWQFRLSSRSSDRNETAAVRSVLQLLDAAPLEFEIDHDGRRESG